MRAARRLFATALRAPKLAAAVVALLALGGASALAVPHWYLYHHGAVHRVPARGPVVALTFDDGPDPRFTPKILDILAEHGATATFFVVGEHVEKYPDIVRRIVAEGHEIGHHSWAHHDMRGRSYEDLCEDHDRCADALRKAAGVQAEWYRPPRKHMTPEQKRMTAEEGMRVAYWTHALEGRAFSRDPDEAVRKFGERLDPGDVLLLHDALGDRSETVARLPEILGMIEERGLRAVTLGEAEERGREQSAKSGTGRRVAGVGARLDACCWGLW